jgi:hypothetical protein
MIYDQYERDEIFLVMIYDQYERDGIFFCSELFLDKCFSNFFIIKNVYI